MCDLAHDRRRVVLVNVTDAPTAQWTAQYLAYYHSVRTHLSLDKDSPEPRAVDRPDLGRVVETPMVGGLHHRYSRLAA
jgi:hypothetical protein